MNSVNSSIPNEPCGVASEDSPDERSDTSAEQPRGDATGRSPKVPEASIQIGMTTQDLRLAVTMSGGVSLAVWMGGDGDPLDWLDNHLVGIEIHDAKRILPTDLLHQAERASPRNVGHISLKGRDNTRRWSR